MFNVKSYVVPESLDEALALMASGELTPIAGGTDLILQMRHGEPRRLLDVRSLDLDFIKADGSVVEIGARVTHSRLRDDPGVRAHLPLLSEAAGLIGTTQIRNRGTIGGNISNASPSADTIPVLLNYDAELVLVSEGAERRVPLHAYITGPYTTERKPRELLRSVVCRRLAENGRCSFVKLGRREAVNISRMTVAVCFEVTGDGKIKSPRVSASSVFPAASRMSEVENLLCGREPSRKLFAEAGALAGELMTKKSEVRWSTPYKRPVLCGLVERALNRAAR